MIRWLLPSALAGLALVAVPIAIHLLIRRRAQRIPFPSLRFVQHAQTAAVRMYLPSDTALLLVRLAIIAMAVVALAKPVVVFPGRSAAWNARTVRGIVVDVSESMKPWTADATAAAQAETRGSVSSVRIDARDLRTGLAVAAARLGAMPPARREIVVVSDFQRGALEPAAVASVPSSIGLRLVRVGAATPGRTVRGVVLFGAEPMSRDVALSGPWTDVRNQPAAPQGGLILLVSAGDTAAARTLERVVAAAGTPAPSSDQPMSVAFPGGTRPAGVTRPTAAWMVETILRLREEVDAADAAAAVEAVSDAATGIDGGGTPGKVDPWHVVFRDRRSHPLVRAAAAGSQLAVDVAAPVSAYVSAAVVRALLIARQGTTARAEDEIERMSSTELAALTRQSAPVTGDTPIGVETAADSRFFWGLVLVLLGVETMIRRTRRAVEATERADAA